jgi:hypothetical protein
LPFFFLEVRRLKLSTNYSISSLITFQCLHPNKDVLLFSLSLTCLFTLLFWGFSCRVTNSLVLVSFDIFLTSIFHYAPCWLYPLCIMSQYCETWFINFSFFFLIVACVIYGTFQILPKSGVFTIFLNVLTSLDVCLRSWTYDTLEITWNQARNETFKVHEMEQLY